MNLEPIPEEAKRSTTNNTQLTTGHAPVRLRVQVGDQIGRAYIMSGETMRIGRALDNDLVLDDVQVSRYHARLIRRGDTLIIEDLGSTNGTLVSGRRIAQPQALQPDDTIAIGRTVFSIEGLPAPDTLAMAPLRPESPRHKVGAEEEVAVSGHARSSTIWLLAAGIAGLVIIVVLILALGGMISYVLSTPAAPVAPVAPVVFVQSPSAGTQVRVNEPVKVSAVANDAQGVMRLELWVGGTLIGQQSVANGETPKTLQAEWVWTPPAAGSYTLQLKAYNIQGVASEPVMLFLVVVPAPTEPPLTATPTPEETGALAITTVALNVRQGPGQHYPILGLVPPGTKLRIVGKNPEATWWQVVYPEGSEGRGWVFADFTQASDTSEVPVVVTPEPPTPTATATSLPTPTYTRMPTFTPSPSPSPTPVGPVVELVAARVSLVPGECTLLQWHIENIKAAYLSGGDFRNLGITGPYGWREACPATTTTYVLRAETGDGVIERVVTVEVRER
ncbi:MAG: hypothetical protein DDG58_01525 [Ardenticatenia bacterium]|jgi:uncharacterized protein YraI|nr:MAG: hypothetical protein DDG58_01525 [Ardenticatenia bacterium]